MKLKAITSTLQAAYVETMVVLKRTSWRRPVSAEQPESTKAILEGRVDPNRPLPENWKAVPNARTPEEEIGVRAISEYEEWNYQWLRHRTQGRNTDGQSLESSVDHEKRVRAVTAFMSAAGTGRTYDELTAEEKHRVQNYFLEFLTRALTQPEYEAVKNEDGAKIDQMIAEELKVKA